MRPFIPTPRSCTATPGMSATLSWLNERGTRSTCWPQWNLRIGQFAQFCTNADETIKERGCSRLAQATAEATRRFGSWYRTGDVTDPKTLNGAYDVVVGLEILEHVGAPRELVRGLLPLLTANGEVVVSTPNRDQYRSDTLWATDLPPVHLHWFSELGMRSLCPPGARAELFDFTAYNHRFGWPSDLRARSGRGRAFLDESLALTDPIPQATLPPWYRRAKHHPASYPLVVGTHRMRETVRSLQDLRKPHRKAIIQYRTSAIVARYSNSLGSSVAD